MADAEKLIAEMYLELKAVRSELSQLRQQVSGLPNFAEGWANPTDAAAALKNEGVKNVKHLAKLRRAAAFSEMKGEIRNTSQGERPTWEYHVPKCRVALQRYFRRLRAVS